LSETNWCQNEQAPREMCVTVKLKPRNHRGGLITWASLGPQRYALHNMTLIPELLLLYQGDLTGEPLLR